jgi:hypothetical protein
LIAATPQARETDMERFKYIWKAPRGHKFFEDTSNGRLAIADDSGDRPDQTDDGVLWVDPGRPICATRDGGMTLPMEAEGGALSVTFVGASEALWVAHRLGMDVSAFGVGGAVYKVVGL